MRSLGSFTKRLRPVFDFSVRLYWDEIAKLSQQSVSAVTMKECLMPKLLWAFSEKLMPLLAFTK